MSREIMLKGDPIFDLFNLFNSFPVSGELKKGFVSNIREKDKKFILDFEAPGFDKKDIDISIEDGYLKVSGKKELKNEVKKEDYHLLESSFGTFERSFKLPENVDIENIDASFKNGMVELSIPKVIEESKVKQISIK